MTEANSITAQLLIEIPKRFPNVRVWRNNRVDAMVTGRGGKLRRVQAGINGQADISGIIGPMGRRLEIEVKSKNDRQSREQMGFELMIQSHGGLYLLGRDVEVCLSALQPHAMLQCGYTPDEECACGRDGHGL